MTLKMLTFFYICKKKKDLTVFLKFFLLKRVNDKEIICSDKVLTFFMFKWSPMSKRNVLFYPLTIVNTPKEAKNMMLKKAPQLVISCA